MPIVTVRHFAMLREIRGQASETVEVEPGITLERLYQQLFPPGPGGAIPVAYTRNRAWSKGGDVVVDGDEIAFLPPLGGG